MNKKGFTLIELIVILVILGILAAITVPSLSGYLESQKAKECSVNRDTILLYLDEMRVTDVTATVESVLESTRGSKVVCPSGGVYSMAGNNETVACDHEGHGSSSAMAEDTKVYEPETMPTLLNKFAVTYYVEDEVYDKKEVPKGANVPLGTPKVRLDKDTNFVGWFVSEEHDEGDAPYENTNEGLQSDLELYASFTTAYIVKYKDTDGTGIALYQVEPSETATAPTSDALQQKLTPVAGKEFAYWALESSPEVEYKFDTKLESSITLVPYMKPLDIGVFISNKGTEKENQVAKNGLLKDPGKMERQGYTFGGWFRDDETFKEEFDFAEDTISGTTYLYAKWTPTPNGSKYLLNLWVEKAGGDENNDVVDIERLDTSKYELVHSVLKTGTAEDKVDVSAAKTAKAASDTTKIGRAFYVASVERGGAGVGEGNNKTLLLDSSSYKADDSANKTIAGNNETVINVYYSRTIFTANFDISQKYGSSAPAALGNMYIELGVGDRTYTVDGRDGTTALGTSPYTLTYKYQDALANKWPDVLRLKGSTGASVFTNWNSYFGLGTKAAGLSLVAVPYMNAANGKHGLWTERTWRRPWRDTFTYYPSIVTDVKYSERRYYYTEVSEQDVRDAGYDPDTIKSTSKSGTKVGEGDEFVKYSGLYYRYNYQAAFIYQSGNPLTNAKGWPGASIDGYYSIVTDATNTAKGLYGTDVYQQVYADPTENSVRGDGVKITHYRINYFMPAQSYTVTLQLNNGTMSDIPAGYTLNGDGVTATATVQYKGEVLLPEKMTKDKAIFTGWYTDEDCTKLYKEGPMPANSLTLYAGFDSVEVEVQYYDEDENKPITTSHYAVGAYLNKHPFGEDTIYVKGKSTPGRGTFAGWYYEIEGDGQKVMIEFQLGVPLSREIYKLYATWNSDLYKITFSYEDAEAEYPKVFDVSSAKPSLAKNGYTEDDIKLDDITGYTFVGWNTEAGKTVENFNTVSVVTGDITVYPAWKPITYNIAFDIGNGSGKMTTQKLTYDKEETLTSFADNCEPPKDYVFLGWSRTKGASAADPDLSGDTVTVKNLKDAEDNMIEKDQTLTLYAVYHEKQ